jgi:hypothetical protein
MLKFPREFIDKLWSGNPLPRDEHGSPVYREGQKDLAAILFLNARWTDVQIKSAIERLDRVPGYVLLVICERIVELVHEADPRPSEIEMVGMDPYMREARMREYEARRKPLPKFTFEGIAEMCIAAILASHEVLSVQKKLSAQRSARAIRRAVL